MKAIGSDSFGDDPQLLEVKEIAIPAPGPGEVRVQVNSVGAHPKDLQILEGMYYGEFRGDDFVGPPYISGVEFSGRIDALGSLPDTRFEVGDRVIGLSPQPLDAQGAYAEYIVLPAQSVVNAPRSLDDEHAAIVLANGVSAYIALTDLKLDRGQTLAVTGAAGSLGRFVIRLAKMRGLTVVADASPADEQRVRALGADVVVARGDDVATRFCQAAPGGADALLDGAMLHEKVVSAVRDGGTFMAVRGWRGQDERDIVWVPLVATDYFTDTATLEKVRDLAEAGALRPKIAKVYSLDQLPKALTRLKKGGLRGERLVVKVRV